MGKYYKAVKFSDCVVRIALMIALIHWMRIPVDDSVC